LESLVQASSFFFLFYPLRSRAAKDEDCRAGDHIRAKNIKDIKIFSIAEQFLTSEIPVSKKNQKDPFHRKDKSQPAVPLSSFQPLPGPVPPD